MVHTLKKLSFLPILALMLMTACSEPSNEAASSNNNAAQSPGGSQPSIAQNGTPTPNNNANTPVAVMPAPASVTQPSDKQPSVQPPAPASSQPVAPPPVPPLAKEAPPGKSPKLVAPSKTLEFGKQPKGKTLEKTFQIRNGGTAALNIEDVHPG